MTLPTLFNLLRTSDDGAIYIGDRRILIFDSLVFDRIILSLTEELGVFETSEKIWNFGYACGFHEGTHLQEENSANDAIEIFTLAVKRLALRGFAKATVEHADILDFDGLLFKVSWWNSWEESLQVYTDESNTSDIFIVGFLSGAASAILQKTVLFITSNKDLDGEKQTALGQINWPSDHVLIRNIETRIENVTKTSFSFTEVMEENQPLLDKLSQLIIELEKKESKINKLEQQVLHLKETYDNRTINEMIGSSGIYQKALDNAMTVAGSDSTVLIQGETGTGKELFARFIHAHSEFENKPLITVNCAALPVSLVESELFGHEKGAFTGATNRKLGRFEIANGTTIFLDEIGELPLETQSKFLRVLQEGEFERLGGSQTIKVKTRVIAATNRDLAELVAEGKFRADLYYRLNVFPIIIPPLRERGDDIALLVNYFAQQFKLKFKKPILSIDQGSINKLKQYSFPGNVRELRHLIERAVLLSTGEILHFHRPSEPDIAAYNGDGEKNALLPANVQDVTLSLKDMEKQYIKAILDKCNGMIAGKGGAAEILEVPPSTLRSKMKKLGII